MPRKPPPKDYCYCPNCGTHWETMLALGQWISTCQRCEVRTEICWKPSTCLQLRRQLAGLAAGPAEPGDGHGDQGGDGTC